MYADDHADSLRSATNDYHIYFTYREDIQSYSREMVRARTISFSPAQRTILTAQSRSLRIFFIRRLRRAEVFIV
jgi:hypothetical protein